MGVIYCRSLCKERDTVHSYIQTYKQLLTVHSCIQTYKQLLTVHSCIQTYKQLLTVHSYIQTYKQLLTVHSYIQTTTYCSQLYTNIQTTTYCSQLYTNIQTTTYCSQLYTNIQTATYWNDLHSNLFYHKVEKTCDVKYFKFRNIVGFTIENLQNIQSKIAVHILLVSTLLSLVFLVHAGRFHLFICKSLQERFKFSIPHLTDVGPHCFIKLAPVKHSPINS